LTESLGGVRVVKGYHAEGREEEVFGGGVKRLLDNILKTLTATSILGLSSSVLVGLVGAVVMYVGARQILARLHDAGTIFFLHRVSRFPGRAHVPDRRHRNAIDRSTSRLERTREILSQSQEDKDPHRVTSLKSVTGDLVFDDVSFAITRAAWCSQRFFPRSSWNRNGSGGIFGFGKVHHHRI